VTCRWQCHTADNFLVAHYDLKPPDTRAYGVSGNVLTIHEAFTYLSLGGFGTYHGLRLFVFTQTDCDISRDSCIANYHALHCGA
jgi:hypothetical protein